MRADEPGRRRPPRSRTGAVPGRAGARRCHRASGQSTVELALVLPVVLVLALAIVQVGLVVRDQVRVTHAAREGARAAAVSADPDAARRAVDANVGLAPDRLEVVTGHRAGTGTPVRVTVRYVVVTDLPLVGPLLPDLSLEAEATMRVER